MGKVIEKIKQFLWCRSMKKKLKEKKNDKNDWPFEWPAISSSFSFFYKYKIQDIYTYMLNKVLIHVNIYTVYTISLITNICV